MSLSVLSSYLRWRSLLVVWADQPWTPAAVAPAQPALTINQWQSEAAGLPPLAWPLPSLPPIPILSLDPSPRLAQAFRQAHRRLHVAAGLGDVIVRDEHTLLQLGGDLAERRGLVLSWDDVAGLRAQPDKRYLLAEAARQCRHGAVLILPPGDAALFARVWRQILAPALGETTAYGLGTGPWPDGIEALTEAPSAVLAALSRVKRSSVSVVNQEIETLREQHWYRKRRKEHLQLELARNPALIDLPLQIEDEQQRISELERRLDDLVGVGDQAAGR